MISPSTVKLWVAVFVITLVETWVILRHSRADRRARRSWSFINSFKSANWSSLVDGTLLVGNILIIKEDNWLIIPSMIGAWLGDLVEHEWRRHKFIKNQQKDEDSE